MGPAAPVLDLDLATEISALVLVGLAVRSYPNALFVWPSLVPIAPAAARFVVPHDQRVMQ